MTIENSKSIRELVRIRWRSMILDLPGGEAFLRCIGKAYRWKEQDMGPHKHSFPGSAP